MNTTIIITTSALLIVMLIPNHAFAFWGGGYCSENNSCNRPCDQYCNNDYNQQPQTTNVDYITTAPNGFSCYGEWRCVSGWNHAIVDAPQDLANGAKVAQSSCPDGHTDQYCNGYTQGYVYAWNIQVNNQNPGQSQQQAQSQQCNINNSPGATCGNEQSANQGQSG